MRTYGRTYDLYGNPSWKVVQTDANGYNDLVYVTAFIQCCKLNLNESPFWSDWGIPARQSVMQQIHPDYYMALMQQRFAGYFANLTVVKATPADGVTPTYNVNILTHSGVTLNASVQIPV
jgi:hypothetical protein